MISAPHVNDPLAFRRSAESERISAVPIPDISAVPPFMIATANLAVSAPFAARLYANGAGTREALVVLHRFGPPHEAEAELVFYSARFSWSRKALADVLSWAAWTVGAMRIVARIPAGDIRLQHLARRAGFLFREHGTPANGNLARWDLPFGGIVSNRLAPTFKPQTRPHDAATLLH